MAHKYKPDKIKILFLGDYNREDYVSLLTACQNTITFLFLHFSSPSEEKSTYYKQFGKAIYWQDYLDAYSLLKETNPAKVVYLYIDTFNQVALNIACQTLKVPTYHLEHGMRADYGIAFRSSVSLPPKTPTVQKAAKLAHKLLNIKSRVKSRLFLDRTISKSSTEDAKFLKHYFAIRSKQNFWDTFEQIKSPKRLASTYISFSPRVYAIHQQYEHLPPQQNVLFIGVPYFDQLAAVVPGKLQKYILFIDQPLAEFRLLGWEKPYKAEFVEGFAQTCLQHGYTIFVKPHPFQDLSVWLPLQEKNMLKIIDDQELLALASKVTYVAGFYSTYLMPFAALPHTTLITFENHPAGNFLVSAPFVNAGVAKVVAQINELHQILPQIQKLHKEQLPNKEKFTEDWLYKFDGKSGERLKNILLTPLPNATTS